MFLKIIYILLEVKCYDFVFTHDDNFTDKIIWDIILINNNVT